MNLFYLDQDPDTNARYHVDSHASKMILEGMQILCTTFHVNNIDAPYRQTHKNHPTCIFARTSKENFNLVVNYVYALSKEFTHRYDNIHKSSLLLKWIWENESRLSFPKIGLTKIALAMPDQYKTSDPVQSYRKYYFFEKGHLACWKNRDIPYWYKEEYFTLDLSK